MLCLNLADEYPPYPNTGKNGKNGKNGGKNGKNGGKNGGVVTLPEGSDVKEFPIAFVA